MAVMPVPAFARYLGMPSLELPAFPPPALPGLTAQFRPEALQERVLRDSQQPVALQAASAPATGTH